MQIVAHRGNARDCPENTLPAFRSALVLGVRHLELDVQLSSDGVPMVVHDATLKRTTGLTGRVHDRTAAALATTEAAERRRFGNQHRGTTIPRLADILALLDGRPDVSLFVEMKAESLERFGLDRVVRCVVEAVAARRTQCVLISFDLAAIARARHLGHPTIGWVLSDYRTRSRQAAEELQPAFLFVNHKRLPRSGALWPGRWQWAVYEVDTLPLARSLAQRGASLIETMAVAKMTKGLAAADGRARP